MEMIKNTVYHLIRGLDIMGSFFFAWTFFIFLFFWVIDGPLYKGIEKVLNIPHKIYFYDVITMAVFIILWVYGIIAVSIYNIKL